MDEKVLGEALLAYGCVGLWIVLSGAVITYNKFLLAVAGFPYPISLTLWCVSLNVYILEASIFTGIFLFRGVLLGH